MYVHSESIRADRVNTVVFNLRQIKHRTYCSGHPVYVLFKLALMAAVYIKYLERSHSPIKHDFLISPRLSILHLGRDLTSYKNFERIL